MNDTSKRRDFLKLAGLATAGVVGAAATVDVQKAAA
ncbi:MAG: twin-arginine translocation signal domain-containing protein, partial [Mesorhizobium sp.]